MIILVRGLEIADPSGPAAAQNSGSARKADAVNTAVDSSDTQANQALLQQANQHADAGHAQAALSCARELLARAEQAQDLVMCAEAMLCLACCELRLLGKFAKAVDLAQRAALLFQRAQHVNGEGRALATQAIAASRLGYYEVAVDSALLAVKVSAAEQPSRDQVMAYHALGIAMYSGKCFVEAGNAYQQAIYLAERCEPPLNAFELHTDLASTESVRYMVERNGGGARLSLDMLEVQINRCHQLLAAATSGNPIATASHTNNLLILALAHTHLLTWRLRFREAAEALQHFKQMQENLQRPWLKAAVHWAQAELAMVKGQLGEAQHWARQTVAVAAEHEHEGLLAVGYQLLSYACELAGDTLGALSALRQLALREQLARAHSLKGRVDLIDRQVELRRQTQQLQRLESDSRLYQRLAMEDGLTGLANRRQFEASLEEWLNMLPTPGASLCLAMIDVNRFKQINYSFSHHVGDEVLRRIAGLLRKHTREPDLPARLAGDEFVIVLRGADELACRQVCARVQQAVRQHDWSALAAGLQVSISVGLAVASIGDTVEALMLRSDERMYADKRASA